jgi:hypothetical protein
MHENDTEKEKVLLELAKQKKELQQEAPGFFEYLEQNKKDPS